MNKLNAPIARGAITTDMMPLQPCAPVIWEVADRLIPYEEAVARMEFLAGEIHMGNEPERVWLVEHPALYTAGTSAKDIDLVMPDRFPVFKTGRGGEYTYHGPGQRVAYTMLNLKYRKADVRAYVAALEAWIISSLEQLNIKGERREDRVGVWVGRPEKPRLDDGSPREDKIAAIGIRIRKWVSFHGISVNVEPELEHFSGIVPCGVQGHGVTSLVDLGHPLSMADFDIVLRQEFENLFGPTQNNLTNSKTNS